LETFFPDKNMSLFGKDVVFRYIAGLTHESRMV